MTYARDQSNPVFLVTLVDQNGVPVTGVTSPTVTLSKAQGANGTTVAWVETTDFTWHELTDGEKCKGLYKLRQVDSPNVDAVDTEGVCSLSVYKTDHNTASGRETYEVEDRASADSLHGRVLRLVEVLATTREINRDTGVQTLYDVAGTTPRYTSTPSEPDAETSKDTIEAV